MQVQMTRVSNTLALLLLAGVVNANTTKLDPPRAKVIPRRDSLHGQVRIDNYAWLREKTNPEVIEYLNNENAYTESVMAHTKALREKIYNELVGRIKETDLSVPVKHGDFFYYNRDEKGKEYKIYARKKGSLSSEEEVLIDLNVLAEDNEFMSLGILEVSPDHTMLAYGIDSTGEERYVVRIKDLRTGRLYDDVIENVHSGAIWANDNQTIYYTVADSAWRPHKLYRHTLGESTANDKLIHFETDEMYWMDVNRTKSDKYIVIDLNSATTSEVRFLDAGNPNGEFRTVQPREKGVEYAIDHRGDKFYILTNDKATNFRLMEAPVDDPSKINWKEIIGHDEQIKLDDAELFANYLVVYARKDGLQTIDVTDFRNGKTQSLTFPETVYSYDQTENPEYETDLLRFNYTSMVTPQSVYEYNMVSGERTLLKEKEVLGGYDRTKYAVERVFATATDGRKIPISLMYLKKTKRDGKNPFYLYGYGSYGSSMDPYFSSNRISLVDRGVVFGIAHIRGGGEMGRIWYDDGKLQNKKNTFTDFIACGEHLIREGWTSKDKLAIGGGSAGGLLIGAVLNMRPDLFHVAIAQVPFVDVINTMLDASIPLTTIEYEEWGNPNVKTDFDYMLSYSPYDNVRKTEYPHMLVTAGLNDPRVGYWEPAKLVAKMRATAIGGNRLLLKTEMEAGHGGSSGRYQALEDLAFEYTFLLDAFGIKE